MQVRLMMTDGGPHPAETLAWSTAQRVVDDFEQAAPEAAYKEVLGLRTTIENIMASHHKMIQEAERTTLKTKGPEHLATPVDTDRWIDDAIDDLISAGRERVGGKPKWPTLYEYFGRPETQQYLEDVLHMEFHQNLQIERSWHADHCLGEQAANDFFGGPCPEQFANHAHAKAFRAVAQQGHAILTLPDHDGPKDADDKPLHLSEHDELGGREVVSQIVVNTMPRQPSKETA